MLASITPKLSLKEKSVSLAAVPPNPATILIVDDEPLNRELLSELLSDQGYKILCACDGEEALQRFKESSPDLVLSDVVMPKVNGFELCRRLKNDPQSSFTPVVLVTGLSASSDRLHGIEAGADDFLNKPFDTHEMLARVSSLLRLKHRTDELECAETVLFALAQSIEAKDPYTVGHCERLADYSSRFAARLGLAEEFITALRRAGIVHDIGKVAVPDSILLKPGPLTEHEWAIMREHTLVGERICAPLKSFRLVLPIIRHHHERRDGSGYPDGLKGDEIPLGARILQLADVYDALSTKRPYKRALSFEEVLETMEAEVKRGWWDPALFAEFRDMLISERQSAPAGQL